MLGENELNWRVAFRLRKHACDEHPGFSFELAKQPWPDKPAGAGKASKLNRGWNSN